MEMGKDTNCLWCSLVLKYPFSVCLFLVSTATEWGCKERERDCDRGIECAIRKSTCQTDGEVAMTTTYTAGCQSCFEGTNEGRRGVREGKVRKGSLFHLSAEPECEFDCQARR